MDKPCATRGGPATLSSRARPQRVERPCATYMRVEHREALEQVKRQHGLRNLHEALDLVLTGSQLAAARTSGPRERAKLPCLPSE